MKNSNFQEIFKLRFCMNSEEFFTPWKFSLWLHENTILINSLRDQVYLREKLSLAIGKFNFTSFSQQMRNVCFNFCLISRKVLWLIEIEVQRIFRKIENWTLENFISILRNLIYETFDKFYWILSSNSLSSIVSLGFLKKL